MHPATGTPLRAGDRVVVLVNASARRSARTCWQPAVDVLSAAADTRVLTPESAEAMAQAVRGAVTDGVRAVVIVGGDGTVNRAANVMAGADTPIGIIPLGTGDDFARAMGLPRDPTDAAKRIVAGRETRVDLVDVNGRLFCTAGLLGIPADAALTVRHWLSPGARTRPLLHLLGGLSYTLAAAGHLLRLELATDRYKVSVDDPVAPAVFVRSNGVFFANTAVIGGGLVLPVKANPADGRLEVAIIRELPRARLVWAFICLAQGWRVPPDVLHIVRTARVSVTCDEQRPFAADGDLMCTGTHFDVCVRPTALRLFC